MNKFFNPAVTADVIVVRNERRTNGTVKQQVLLIRRREDPDKGMWAFPGGHMDSTDASVEDAAVRELKEETGIVAKHLRPVGVLSQQNRMDDPCMCHVFVYSYWRDNEDPAANAGDDAADATWFTVKTRYHERANSLRMELDDGEGDTIAFSAKFSLTPYGVAETEIAWDEEKTTEMIAFDHPNMLAKCFMRLPGFVNIGVEDGGEGEK